jgi:peptidyl-prolyl cis-trans isomerase SurA
MNHRKSFKSALKTVALSGLFFYAVAASAELALLDRVVAIVDDDVVLHSELNRRLAAVYEQIQQSGTQPPAEEIIREQVLERLISERLQLNIGYKAGVRISDEEINQTLARVAAGNNLSIEEYVAAIDASGSSMASVRRDIANELTIMRVQQGRVMGRIRISEQELDNFLNSEEGKLVTSADVKLGQILISVPLDTSIAETQLIEEKVAAIAQEIATGTDFRQLAIANSDDQSALEGGDLGWRKMAQLPRVFTTALTAMDIGQVSEPIRSAAGYHLLKLYDRRGGEKTLIEQHFARHILLKPDQLRDEAATIQELRDLRQQIVDGSDFASLSKEHSEDPGSALKGGELGWSTPGMFVPEFEQIMNSIALNEVSQPFKSQFGWHILQVTERRMEDFSENMLRNGAENLLRQRKFSEELQVWLQEIRDEAFVEIKEINKS